MGRGCCFLPVGLSLLDRGFQSFALVSRQTICAGRHSGFFIIPLPVALLFGDGVLLGLIFIIDLAELLR